LSQQLPNLHALAYLNRSLRYLPGNAKTWTDFNLGLDFRSKFRPGLELFFAHSHHLDSADGLWLSGWLGATSQNRNQGTSTERKRQTGRHNPPIVISVHADQACGRPRKLELRDRF
jgi:hypothetical protein